MSAIHALNLGGGASGVSAAAVIADNVLARGDGGARGIQGSIWTLSDGGNMIGTSATEDTSVLLVTATGEEGRGLHGIAQGLDGIGVRGSNNTLRGIGLFGSSNILNGVAIQAEAGDSGAVPLRIKNFAGFTADLFFGGGASIILNAPQTGGILPAAIVATATLDFPSTDGGAVSDLTITVTGAAVGDVVCLGVPAASVPSASGSYSAWVSAADTVKVRFANNALLSAENPASGSFKVAVLKF